MSSCRTTIPTMLMSIRILQWRGQNWNNSARNWVSYRSCWQRPTIIAYLSCCRGWIPVAKLIRFTRSSPESIRRDARCVRLKYLHLGNWTMTSSGVCIGSLQAEVSLEFSIAPTMRTCWSCACITWCHKRSGVATNDFERLLAQHDMILLKLYLHMSNDEQERRLLAQQKNQTDAWKVTTADWAERKYWDEYQEAYEEALSKCSTDKAPWYIVPANQKWYRNLVVARTLVSTLRQYKDGWEGQLVERGERELALLAQLGHLEQTGNREDKRTKKAQKARSAT